MESYSGSSVSPWLAEWCSQIDILRYIQPENFAESFSDGVLFYYLVEKLLPEMTIELAVLKNQVNKVVVDTDYFGKLNNWILLGGVVLEKLKIPRSEWFLSYVARGKDGYIQDLLDDFKKIVPDPREVTESQQEVTESQQSVTFNVSQDADDAIEEMDEVQEDLKFTKQKPSLSFSFKQKQTTTPSEDEKEYAQPRQRRWDNWRNSRGSWNEGEDSTRYEQWGSQQHRHYQQQPLRRIQRNGNRDFFNKTNQTNFRYFRNNRRGNRNSYRMNQWSEDKARRAKGYYQRYLIPRNPQPDPMPPHTQRAWNWNQQNQEYQQQEQEQGNEEQITEQEYLNQRFNDLQESNLDAGGRATSYRTWTPEYRKYFYKYYVQFIPVSCNYCTDNGLECHCPRFGYDEYNQYKNKRGNSYKFRKQRGYNYR